MVPCSLQIQWVRSARVSGWIYWRSPVCSLAPCHLAWTNGSDFRGVQHIGWTSWLGRLWNGSHPHSQSTFEDLNINMAQLFRWKQGKRTTDGFIAKFSSPVITERKKTTGKKKRERKGEDNPMKRESARRISWPCTFPRDKHWSSKRKKKTS